MSFIVEPQEHASGMSRYQSRQPFKNLRERHFMNIVAIGKYLQVNMVAQNTKIFEARVFPIAGALAACRRLHSSGSRSPRCETERVSVGIVNHVLCKNRTYTKRFEQFKSEIETTSPDHPFTIKSLGRQRTREINPVNKRSLSR